MSWPTRPIMIASIPAAVAGAWNLGDQLGPYVAAGEAVWQIEWVRLLGIQPRPGQSPLASLALGSAFLVPLLATALATSRAWAELFARARNRPLDKGWWLTAWLYTLLLPASMPLPYAAIGISFGLVFGCHVFGGTGRHIVNPALLAVAFLAVAYPGFLEADQWLPGAEVTTTWAVLGAGGIDALDGGWAEIFLGRETGALGASSAAACLLGAVYLTLQRTASVRVLLGAMAGLALAGIPGGDIPWFWHLAAGNFALVLALFATDPAINPASRFGQWAFGGMFAVLTIALRMANPEHPEGAVPALLLVSLCVPLLDYLAHAVDAARNPQGAEP